MRSMFDCSLFRCEDNTDGKVATYIPQLARFQIDYTVSEIKNSLNTIKDELIYEER